MPGRTATLAAGAAGAAGGAGAEQPISQPNTPNVRK